MSSSRSPSARRSEELLLVHVVGDLAVDEVGELVGVRKVVDGDDVGLAAVVQRTDEIRADESGGSGDDGVHVRFFRIRGSDAADIGF